MNSIVFIDTEVNPQNNQLLDLGAVKPDNSKFHSASQSEFSKFISDSDYICGHNILAHDIKYIEHLVDESKDVFIIDTLCLSPLLFPNRPYHALLKDDKLQVEELNNPLNDSIKAMELFFDEINAFEALNENLKQIYSALLSEWQQFYGFFKYIDFIQNSDIERIIIDEFSGKICDNVPLSSIIKNNPIELAYCLALISANDRFSITPPWVHRNFPAVENIMKLLRNTPCTGGCTYCSSSLDVRIRLKSIFGYDEFRKYNGEPLQEKAAESAVCNRSLLAIFPTGGGKSITFQLPALIAGETSRGLTIVISPLQSLMKDQVDNLVALGIADAVTVNGLLSPIERAEAFSRVESGLATILYISPESLRSKTILKLLLSRNVVRFVVDEAHCFSSWGQDFRVDYLYIGDFIKELQEMKNLSENIPVSCFTATAKQKVISDIRDYFKQKLNLDLELYATNATRSNLRYAVLYRESDDEKYTTLRDLIAQRNCPTIVYVSRTKRTFDIAQKLTEDGFSARPFNGKMESSEKIINQEAFIAGEV
ncbi:MAG TPA: DEAD/DEAH box helicase, partial [Clostridiales bacterium]|nr:DEAD/DEAH box helicase [Clostridiales bacterium]